MSWGTCYKASNNIYFDFPAMMSDGTLFTNWNTACKMNDQLKQRANIQDNYQYRQYLINNGNTIANQNANNVFKRTGGVRKFESSELSGKYLFKYCNDGSMPFGYEGSDLKNLYLSRQALESRLNAPIITQSQMLSRPNFN